MKFIKHNWLFFSLTILYFLFVFFDYFLISISYPIKHVIIFLFPFILLLFCFEQNDSKKLHKYWHDSTKVSLTLRGMGCYDISTDDVLDSYYEYLKGKTNKAETLSKMINRSRSLNNRRLNTYDNATNFINIYCAYYYCTHYSESFDEAKEQNIIIIFDRCFNLSYTNWIIRYYEDCKTNDDWFYESKFRKYYIEYISHCLLDEQQIDYKGFCEYSSKKEQQRKRLLDESL